MNYHRRYSSDPELVKKLDRIKYMIHSVGGLDTDVEIDFDVDLIEGSTMVYGFQLYVGESYVIDGFVHEITNVIEETTEKVVNVFKRIKLDENLNLSKTSENFFSDEPIVSQLNYNYRDGDFKYELMFLFEIVG